MNAPELKWELGAAVPADAVLDGQSGGKPMNICRMPMPNKELHAGKAWNGSCYAGFGGKELKIAQFEVLAAGAAAAQAGGMPELATVQAEYDKAKADRSASHNEMMAARRAGDSKKANELAKKTTELQKIADRARSRLSAVQAAIARQESMKKRQEALKK